MSCKAGKHRWASGKGKPGEKCTKCGDPHRGRGRPKLKAAVRPAPAAAKSKPAAPRPVAEDAAARLAAALGSPVTPAPTSPDEKPQPVEVLPPGAPLEGDKEKAADENLNTTSRWIARRLTKVFVGMTDWALSLAKRDAGEPDDEDEEQFAEGLGRAIRDKWEDRGLSPGWQMGLAGAFIVGEMCLGSEKIPEPEKKPATTVTLPPLVTPSVVNGAATTADAIPLQD